MGKETFIGQLEPGMAVMVHGQHGKLEAVFSCPSWRPDESLILIKGQPFSIPNDRLSEPVTVGPPVPDPRPVSLITVDWYEFISHGLCGLCGNRGVIDTSATAVSPNGIHVGNKYFCICPNGRQMRELAIKKTGDQHPLPEDAT